MSAGEQRGNISLNLNLQERVFKDQSCDLDQYELEYSPNPGWILQKTFPKPLSLWDTLRTNILKTSCKYSKILPKQSTHSEVSPHMYSTNITEILFKHSPNVAQILLKYFGNILQTLYKYFTILQMVNKYS